MKTNQYGDAASKEAATALQRQRVEEALHRQAQIIDQIHDAVVSTDLEGLHRCQALGGRGFIVGHGCVRLAALTRKVVQWTRGKSGQARTYGKRSYPVHAGAPRLTMR